MRQLSLHKGVIKVLAQLPAKPYRQVVTAIFELLAEPAPHYSKRLADSPYFRMVVGQYRVIYRVDDKAVVIVA